ncbi:MAG: phosphoenolpyruvate carboxykinase, partial [Firmicutes bacterium]|nr:phosphoenolpyruvate carboxykinase [Bacillota bacterium]
MIEIKNTNVLEWVKECAELTNPDSIMWIDGSEEQLEALRAEACATGEMIKLNQEKLPGCYYYRTHPRDVARDEKRTVICTRRKEDAGPTNNWVDPQEMYDKMGKLFDGSMKGRKMYVIPFSMGIVGTDFSKIGIEITDSIYVVLSMAIMTRVGKEVIDALNAGADFTKCLHSKADINEQEKYIA